MDYTHIYQAPSPNNIVYGSYIAHDAFFRDENYGYFIGTSFKFNHIGLSAYLKMNYGINTTFNTYIRNQYIYYSTVAFSAGVKKIIISKKGLFSFKKYL